MGRQSDDLVKGAAPDSLLAVMARAPWKTSKDGSHSYCMEHWSPEIADMIYAIYDLTQSDMGYQASFHGSRVYAYWDDPVSGHYYWVIGKAPHVHPKTRGWHGEFRVGYMAGRPDGADGFPVICNRRQLPNPHPRVDSTTPADPEGYLQ